MKKSFTLIETMVAVIIFFIAVFAIMNILANSKYLVNELFNQEDFNIKSTVALIEAKNVKNIYDQLSDFNIDNDKIIRHLKQEKITIKKKEVFNEDINYSDIKALKINKIIAYDKYHKNGVYELEIVK